MKILELLARCIFCVALFASLAFSDSIQLRNGRQMHGKYIGGTPSAVGFMTGGAVQYIPTSEVLSLVFDSNPETPLGEIEPNSLHPGAPVHIRPGVLRSTEESLPAGSVDFSLPARTVWFTQLAQMVPLISSENAEPNPLYGQSADTNSPAALNLNLISWAMD